MAGVALCFMLASFSFMRGGDSYSILLNNKEVAKYYVFSKDPLPSLSLEANASSQLSVYYSECGKIGTSRKLSLRDEQNKILKEWKFTDVLNVNTPMTVKASEFGVTANQLSLYYTSAVVPDGRKLADLTILAKQKTASR